MIQKAQKHVDPVDPDTDWDPDPQHCTLDPKPHGLKFKHTASTVWHVKSHR
jgi:hypothetical protein